MKKTTAAFVLIFFAMLVGCGGSGGSALSATKVTIAWPMITREITAPGYAGSAQITLSVASSPTASQWFVDRPLGDSAKTLTYESPEKYKGGPATLEIRFFSGPAGTGMEVATAAVSVRIDEQGNLLNSAGGPLETVSYGTAMNGFFIDRDRIAINDSKPIIVSGSFNGFIMAIPQNLATMEIVENPENASLVDRVLTGIQEGTFQVYISVEGQSATISMKTTPKLATASRVAFAANIIAYDSAHHRLWGTFSSGSQYPNSIVDIDPLTGVVGNPILVGGSPGQIAVSPDGSTAYVGLSDSSSVRKVNLDTRQPGNLIPISFDGSDVRFTSIDVNPENPNEFAICGGENGSSGFRGPVVYRNGSQVGSLPGLYTSYLAKYSSASTITGVQLGISSGTLFTYEVSLNSVDQTASRDTNNSLFGYFRVVGTKAMLSNGYIFDAFNLNVIGQLGFGNEVPRNIVWDETGDTAWATMEGSSSNDPVHIRRFDMGSFNVIASEDIEFPIQGEAPVQIERFGASGMAILTNKALYLLPNAPGL